MALYAAGTFLFSVVAWLVYYFYVNASHNVKPWRTVKGRLMDLAESEGFTVDRERCTAYGELEGVPFAFGLKTMRRGKSRHMQLWAALESSEIPLDLEVSAECVLSGVSRALGYKEATLGEPEFDAAFWILTDDVERARYFLTPSRRRGFLHGLTAVSDGKIKKQKVQAIQRFSTPLRMSRHFRPLLENFRLLAETLNDSGATSLAAGGSLGCRGPKSKTLCTNQLRLSLVRPFRVLASSHNPPPVDLVESGVGTSSECGRSGQSDRDNSGSSPGLLRFSGCGDRGVRGRRHVLDVPAFR